MTRAGIPEPGAGQWVATTVALLNYSHDRCAEVGDRVVAQWKRMGHQRGVPSALNYYVLTTATADLAGARKALDVARGFLPQARIELDSADGKVLERLYKAQSDLCNLAGRPTAPRDVFVGTLIEASQHVAEAEGRLGEILALPERSVLAKKLQPYMTTIERAAAAAREEVRQELEALRPPPPPPPTMQQLMEAWHGRYEKAVLPTKTALNDYRLGRQKSNPRAIQVACRALLSAVNPLLHDEQVFQAPDEQLEAPLRSAYVYMRAMGYDCTAGRFVKADETYAKLMEKLALAAHLLAPYSLDP